MNFPYMMADFHEPLVEPEKPGTHYIVIECGSGHTISLTYHNMTESRALEEAEMYVAEDAIPDVTAIFTMPF